MTKIQNFKMYINGLWVNSESGKTIETVNPENNEVWATVPEANEKDVDKAVKAAQNAFEKSWSNLHPRERAKCLRSLADQLRQNAEHLGTIETIDTGKFLEKQKHKLTILLSIMIILLDWPIKLKEQLCQLIRLTCKLRLLEYLLVLLRR